MHKVKMSIAPTLNKYLHILRLIYLGVVPIVAGLAVVAAHPAGPTGMDVV